MLIAIIATLLSIGLSVFIHYEVLRWVSDLIPRMTMAPRSRLLVVLGAVFIAHFLEIMVFAAAYYLMHLDPALGTLEGPHERHIVDFIYFSAATYTTLGIGDLFPTEHIRMVVGAESLAGLVLITWSASFTYLTMEKFWDLHPRRKRAHKD